MTSQAETFCRHRRLYDVRRGVVYLRRTDDLAQRQWRHYGAVPAIQTHVIRDIGVTTRLSDGTDSQHDTSAHQSLNEAKDLDMSDAKEVSSDVRESGSSATRGGRQVGTSGERTVTYKTTVLEDSKSGVHPQISLTEVTDAVSSTAAGGEVTDTVSSTAAAGTPGPQPPHSHPATAADGRRTNSNDPDPAPPSALPHEGVSSSWADPDLPVPELGVMTRLPAFPQPASTSKHHRHSLREGLTWGGQPTCGGHFDTWGSRDWALDKKLAPSADRQPRGPKHYPPMSRASRLAGGREGQGEGVGARRPHLNTLTDFRSHNGTVRVIRPLPPLADTQVRAGVWPERVEDDDLDLARLEREQTYAMLKRIDCLLEPSRAFFTPDLTSSQREVCSSTPPTLSPLMETLQDGDSDHHIPTLQDGDADDHVPSPHSRQHDVVHVHRHDFHVSFGDSFHGHQLQQQPALQLTDSQNLHQHPSQQLTDSEHVYISRLQRRLNQFYGHHSNRSLSWEVGDRFVKTPRHLACGNLESLGKYSTRAGRHDPAGEAVSIAGHLATRGPPASGQLCRQTGQAHTFPPLPPAKFLQSTPKRPGPEGVPHQHAGAFLTQASCTRTDGARGKDAGIKRKEWGSLSQVVAQLEKKGVDLHLKCQDWVARSFS